MQFISPATLAFDTIITMNGLLEQVLKSPQLIDWSDSINRKLEVERASRKKFRQQLSEKREEFINGEVIAQVSNRDMHMVSLDLMATLISIYVRKHQLGSVRREQSLTEFPRNDYCPDLCFWPSEADIGTDPNQLIYPPPKFIIEVLSPSTEARDRGVKFEDYEAHGVKEYWIVDPDRRSIEQYLERDGRYEKSFAGQAGLLRSSVIAGFEMPVEAAFDDDLQMKALQEMLSRQS